MSTAQRMYWRQLSQDERTACLKRPAIANDADLQAGVRDIITAVRERGDDAVREFTRQFDRIDVPVTAVSPDEFAQAEAALEPRQIAAIEQAISNVGAFHEAQRPNDIVLETSPGVVCQRINQPIESVGLYVPAGSAPLPSAAVMLAVPAAIAGCPQRILCTPAKDNGAADPAVLVAAARAGVSEIYKIGGAQAIAAMAYGTASVPKVEKIFGPGNAWVTAAKTQVSADPAGAAIDMPAGPSEVLVIADASANAEFVAADLLSQAEHGADSQVILLCTDSSLVDQVDKALGEQLASLSRREIAGAALAHSRLITVDAVSDAVAISNNYAPEHLILQVENARELLPLVRNAGSVFVGPWSPESVGDYCSGTNHVLPTYGAAKRFSGLGVDQFMRQMTVQELSRDGLAGLANTVLELAGMEGLDAHANAVTCRLESGGDA